MNFNTGDTITLSEKGHKTYSENDWAGYDVPYKIFKFGGTVTSVESDPFDKEYPTKIYVKSLNGSSTIWLEPEDIVAVARVLLLDNTVHDSNAVKNDEYKDNHYDNYYTLTETDIKEGKIKMDAYFVAKVWRTGSRDDSGALWHSLKTIARFGDKNPIEREIKALYNQAKALGRIYGVDLDD